MMSLKKSIGWLITFIITFITSYFMVNMVAIELNIFQILGYALLLLLASLLAFRVFHFNGIRLTFVYPEKLKSFLYVFPLFLLLIGNYTTTIWIKYMLFFFFSISLGVSLVVLLNLDEGKSKIWVLIIGILLGYSILSIMGLLFIMLDLTNFIEMFYWGISLVVFMGIFKDINKKGNNNIHVNIEELLSLILCLSLVIFGTLSIYPNLQRTVGQDYQRNHVEAVNLFRLEKFEMVQEIMYYSYIGQARMYSGPITLDNASMIEHSLWFLVILSAYFLNKSFFSRNDNIKGAVVGVLSFSFFGSLGWVYWTFLKYCTNISFKDIIYNVRWYTYLLEGYTYSGIRLIDLKSEAFTIIYLAFCISSILNKDIIENHFLNILITIITFSMLFTHPPVFFFLSIIINIIVIMENKLKNWLIPFILTSIFSLPFLYIWSQSGISFIIIIFSIISLLITMFCISFNNVLKSMINYIFIKFKYIFSHYNYWFPLFFNCFFINGLIVYIYLLSKSLFSQNMFNNNYLVGYVPWFIYPLFLGGQIIFVSFNRFREMFKYKYIILILSLIIVISTTKISSILNMTSHIIGYTEFRIFNSSYGNLLISPLIAIGLINLYSYLNNKIRNAKFLVILLSFIFIMNSLSLVITRSYWNNSNQVTLVVSDNILDNTSIFRIDSKTVNYPILITPTRRLYHQALFNVIPINRFSTPLMNALWHTDDLFEAIYILHNIRQSNERATYYFYTTPQYYMYAGNAIRFIISYAKPIMLSKDLEIYRLDSLNNLPYSNSTTSLLMDYRINNNKNKIIPTILSFLTEIKSTYKIEYIFDKNNLSTLIIPINSLYYETNDLFNNINLLNLSYKNLIILDDSQNPYFLPFSDDLFEDTKFGKIEFNRDTWKIEEGFNINVFENNNNIAHIQMNRFDITSETGKFYIKHDPEINMYLYSVMIKGSNITISDRGLIKTRVIVRYLDNSRDLFTSHIKQNNFKWNNYTFPILLNSSKSVKDIIIQPVYIKSRVKGDIYFKEITLIPLINATSISLKGINYNFTKPIIMPYFLPKKSNSFYGFINSDKGNSIPVLTSVKKNNSDIYYMNFRPFSIPNIMSLEQTNKIFILIGDLLPIEKDIYKIQQEDITDTPFHASSLIGKGVFKVNTPDLTIITNDKSNKLIRHIRLNNSLADFNFQAEGQFKINIFSGAIISVEFNPSENISNLSSLNEYNNFTLLFNAPATISISGSGNMENVFSDPSFVTSMGIGRLRGGRSIDFNGELSMVITYGGEIINGKILKLKGTFNKNPPLVTFQNWKITIVSFFITLLIPTIIIMIKNKLNIVIHFKSI